MKIYFDQLNRAIHLKAVPKRIVSLVPSQTELLVDLGLESAIVGITKFCVQPDYLRSHKVKVGGTKQINIDKIKALQPDIILCNKEENTKAMVLSLQNIAPVHVSDVNTLEDSFELMTMYGTIFNVLETANQLQSSIQSNRAAFLEIKKKNTMLSAAYFIWKQPWMVAGGDTFINVMLKEFGVQNCFEEQKRYPEILIDDKALSKADFLFLSSEPYPFKPSDLQLLKAKFPGKTIVLVDGEMFSWYGSRLQNAYSYFKQLYDDIMQ